MVLFKFYDCGRVSAKRIYIRMVRIAKTNFYFQIFYIAACTNCKMRNVKIN